MWMEMVRSSQQISHGPSSGRLISTLANSIDWCKGKITGKSHISWENGWFPIDFPSSQPIEDCLHCVAFLAPPEALRGMFQAAGSPGGARRGSRDLRRRSQCHAGAATSRVAVEEGSMGRFERDGRQIQKP